MSFISKIKQFLLLIIIGRRYRLAFMLAMRGMVVHITKTHMTSHISEMTCEICCEHCDLPFDGERMTLWRKKEEVNE